MIDFGKCISQGHTNIIMVIPMSILRVIIFEIVVIRIICSMVAIMSFFGIHRMHQKSDIVWILLRHFYKITLSALRVRMRIRTVDFAWRSIRFLMCGIHLIYMAERSFLDALVSSVKIIMYWIQPIVFMSGKSSYPRLQIIWSLRVNGESIFLSNTLHLHSMFPWQENISRWQKSRLNIWVGHGEKKMSRRNQARIISHCRSVSMMNRSCEIKWLVRI